MKGNRKKSNRISYFRGKEKPLRTGRPRKLTLAPICLPLAQPQRLDRSLQPRKIRRKLNIHQQSPQPRRPLQVRHERRAQGRGRGESQKGKTQKEEAIIRR